MPPITTVSSPPPPFTAQVRRRSRPYRRSSPSPIRPEIPATAGRTGKQHRAVGDTPTLTPLDCRCLGKLRRTRSSRRRRRQRRQHPKSSRKQVSVPPPPLTEAPSHSCLMRCRLALTFCCPPPPLTVAPSTIVPDATPPELTFCCPPLPLLTCAPSKIVPIAMPPELTTWLSTAAATYLCAAYDCPTLRCHHRLRSPCHLHRRFPWHPRRSSRSCDHRS